MLRFRSSVVGSAELIILVVGCTLFTAPGLYSAQRYHWPTLAEVLGQNSVPLPPPNVDTDITITSFGVVNEPSQFAIAYYRDSGSEALRPPLYVLRYDKSRQQWYQRAFKRGEVQAPFTTGLNPGEKPLMVDCLGSASISTAARFLLVSTHLSPSAECTMILHPDLKLVSAFSGWNVATIGSEIVVERSEIHFAATHPLRLAVVDLASGRERDLFPAANDRLREGYQDRLAATRDLAWCRQHDSPCEPQQMSADLGKVAVNTAAQTVAVEVTFSPEGFGPAAQAQLTPEKCFYVFKLTPRLESREFGESDLQRRFGIASPETLVRREVLQRIFAANDER